MADVIWLWIMDRCRDGAQFHRDVVDLLGQEVQTGVALTTHPTHSARSPVSKLQDISVASANI